MLSYALVPLTVVATVVLGLGTTAGALEEPFTLPPETRSPESGGPLKIVGELSGETWAIAVRGDTAYYGVGSSIWTAHLGGSIFSVSRSVSMGGTIADLVVEDCHAYVAMGEAGVGVASIDGLQPAERLARLDTPGSASGLAVRGEWLYIADGDAGLHVANVPDPRAPAISSTLAFRSARDVVVIRDRLAVGHADGVDVMDLSDPARPNALLSIRLAGVSSLATTAEGNLLIAHTGGLHEVELIGTGYEVVRSIDVELSARSIAASHGVAYAAEYRQSASTVRRFVADGATYVEIRDQSGPPWRFEIGAMAVALHGDDLLVGSGPGVVQISPTGDVAFAFPETAYRTEAMAAHGTYLYSVGGGVLSIFDTTVMAAEPVIGRIGVRLAYPAQTVRTDGNKVWIAANRIGRGSEQPFAEVIDVSDPSNPEPVTLLTQPVGLTSDASVLDFDDGVLYASYSEDGGRALTRWDVVEDVLTHVYSVGLTGFASVVDVERPLLAVATGQRCSGVNGLTLVREDGASASLDEVFVTDESWSTEAVEIEGDHIFVLRSNCGEAGSKLEVYRIADSEPTRLVGEVELPGSALMGGPFVEPVAMGAYMYVSEGGAGLSIVDVSVPEAPQLTSTVAPDDLFILTGAGNSLYGLFDYGILRQYRHVGVVAQPEATYRAYVPRSLTNRPVGCPP